MSKKQFNKDSATKTFIRFGRRAIRVVASAVVLTGSVLGLIMFCAAWNLLQSDFVVHMVNSLRHHALDNRRLQKKNKVEWFLVDGQYSKEFERNAPAREWVKKFAKICNLKVVVKNRNKIPTSGKLIVIANHDNTQAPIFLASIVDEARGVDTTKVLSVMDYHKSFYIKGVADGGVSPTLLPDVEEKINAHLQAGNPLIIFPKTADFFTAKHYKTDGKTDPVFRFMDGFLRFAIQNESDILPVKVHLDYPWWWRIMWFIVPKDLGMQILRTYMYQIYRNTTLHITIGDVIPYSKIKNDASSAYTKRGKTRYPDDVVAKYEHAIMSLG